MLKFEYDKSSSSSPSTEKALPTSIAPPQVIFKIMQKGSAHSTITKTKSTQCDKSPSAMVPVVQVPSSPPPSPPPQVISVNAKTVKSRSTKSTKSTKKMLTKAKQATKALPTKTVVTKAKSTKVTPKSSPKSPKRSRPTSAKSVTPQKRVKSRASSKQPANAQKMDLIESIPAPMSSSVIRSGDPFVLFLTTHLPTVLHATLMEHAVLYLKDVFTKPKQHTLSGVLYAMHQRYHWRAPVPHHNDLAAYRSEIARIEQEVMVVNKGRLDAKPYADHLYYNGYVQAAIESLMVSANPEASPVMRLEHRKERLRLPFLFRLCQDCRLVLLLVLCLLHSPAKKRRSCPQYDLPTEARCFLTTDSDFVDYYSYFKVSFSTGNDFIDGCLKLYCVEKPGGDAADDAYDMEKADFRENLQVCVC